MTMERKTVALLCGHLAGGGAERVVAELAKHLDRRRFRPIVILQQRRIDYPLPADVPIFLIPQPRPARTPWGKLWNLAGRVAALRRILREQRADVVNSHLPQQNLLAMLATRGLRCTVVPTEHNSPRINFRRFAAPWLWHLLSWSYRFADAIVTVSEGLSREFERTYRLPPGKVRTIYNPVDSAALRKAAKERVRHPWFGRPHKTPVLISMGRLIRQKGFDVLLKAFALLRQRRDCRLAILGQGEDERQLKRLALELGIAKDTAFLGFQKNPFAYIARTAAFVHSSRWEGFPCSLIETAAIGTPIIATDCPYGPRELLRDGKDGPLVPVEDPAALADAAERLLADSVQQKRLRAAVLRRSRDFEAAKIVNQYERLFMEDYRSVSMLPRGSATVSAST
jgi:glycosyltransferase involved in cell wall biosynthesis